MSDRDVNTARMDPGEVTLGKRPCRNCGTHVMARLMGEDGWCDFCEKYAPKPRYDAQHSLEIALEMLDRYLSDLPKYHDVLIQVAAASAGTHALNILGRDVAEPKPEAA